MVHWIFTVFFGAWDTWAAATCMPDACFCEALRDGWIRQPANTISNLGFVVVGIVVLARARAAADAPMGTVPTATYGVAAVLVGASSTFYHASLTFVGQTFDVLAMYLLATFIILYNARTLARWSARRFVVWYAATNIAGLGVLVVLPEGRRYLFGLMIATALVSEIVVRRRVARDAQLGWMGLALASLAVAFGVWILDIKKIWCDPTSPVQGHAIWHLLTAVSAGAVWLYYRSETQRASVNGSRSMTGTDS